MKTPLLDGITKEAFIYVQTGTRRGPEIRVNDKIRAALRSRHSKRRIGGLLGGGLIGGVVGGGLGYMGGPVGMLAGGVGGTLLGGLLGNASHNRGAKRIKNAVTMRGALTRAYGMPSEEKLRDLYSNLAKSMKDGEPDLKHFSVARYLKK